jgi:tetratricopeptide (TPR) repeat protein
MRDAMGVVGWSAACLWLVAFALAGSAQVAEYVEALRTARNAGDGAAIVLLERLTRESPEFLQAHRALIAITRRAGDPQRAERHFEWLSNSPRARPYACYGLAAYHNSRRNYAHAKEHAVQSLALMPDFLPGYGELAKAAADPSLRPQIRKMIEDQQQARSRAAGPLYARALLHIEDGHWSEAIPLLVKADELAPGAWEISDALFHSYYRTDQSANTLAVLDRALDVSRQRNDTEREGIVLGRIGIVQSDLGDYEKALGNLERAVEIMTDLTFDQFEQAYRANLGNTLLLTGRHIDALSHLERALAICRRTGDRGNEGRVVGLMALVHLDGADYPAAIRAFTKAAAIARETGDKASEADQTASLALIYSLLGDAEKALEYVGARGPVPRNHRIYTKQPGRESAGGRRVSSGHTDRAAHRRPYG